MSLSPLDRPGQWTFDELVQLPDDGRRWEVVDGVLIALSPASKLHERVSFRLAVQLERQVPSGWEVLHEFGLRLGSDGRIPDVGIARTDVPLRRGDVGTHAGDMALLVEVVSPSTRKNDRFVKPIEYAQAGVPCYWRVEVDPELFVVTHELVDSRYVETGVLRGVHALEAPVPLVLDVPALLPPQLVQD